MGGLIIFSQNNFNDDILFSNRSNTSNVWQNVSSLSPHVVREKLESLEAPFIGAAPSKKFHLPALC